ncbi:MAG: hypothetical protein PVG49_12910, partial [Desulfobacteraceae bacterium]
MTVFTAYKAPLLPECEGTEEGFAPESFFQISDNLLHSLLHRKHATGAKEKKPPANIISGEVGCIDRGFGDPAGTVYQAVRRSFHQDH